MAVKRYKEHVWGVDDLGRDVLLHAAGDLVVVPDDQADDDTDAEEKAVTRRRTKAVRNQEDKAG